MKQKKPRRPRIRAPVPQPGRYHSTKKGKKGYSRSGEVREVRREFRRRTR